MRHLLVLASLATMFTACIGEAPPPPQLEVTSPTRGLSQGAVGDVVVKGFTGPNIDGEAVVRVTVNEQPAQLGADGSFTATLDLSAGATLLQTVAYTASGGKATDARAVHVGELVPVSSIHQRGVVASLDAKTFTKVAAATSTYLSTLDLPAKLAPENPMASLGNSIANVDLNIDKVTMGDIRITLVPTAAGLSFSAEITGVGVGARAEYDGTLVPQGSTSVMMKTDKIAISGILNIGGGDNTGFRATITTPRFEATNMKLEATGLVGRIAELIFNNLSGTIQKVMSRSIETALTPMINQAFASLDGPKRIEVLKQGLELEVSPAAVNFSDDGALIALNLGAQLDGNDETRFISTPNGTPRITTGNGIQVGISDDLVNALLAQIHHLGLLKFSVEQDLGLIDRVDLEMKLPPMVSAINEDGSLRLVIGELEASFTKDGASVVKAAVNAQVDVSVTPADDGKVAIELGDIRFWADLLPGSQEGYDISSYAEGGLGFQLEKLEPFLVEVPLPTVAGITLANPGLRTDSGYLVMSADVR